MVNGETLQKLHGMLKAFMRGGEAALSPDAKAIVLMRADDGTCAFAGTMAMDMAVSSLLTVLSSLIPQFADSPESAVEVLRMCATILNNKADIIEKTPAPTLPPNPSAN